MDWSEYWPPGVLWTRHNAAGDKGQPWLVPHPKSNALLLQTLAKGEWYNRQIQLMNISLKPKLSKTAYKYIHSTESNAFRVSRATRTLEPLLVWGHWILAKFKVLLPGIYLVLSGCRRVKITWFGLRFARRISSVGRMRSSNTNRNI